MCDQPRDAPLPSAMPILGCESLVIGMTPNLATRNGGRHHDTSPFARNE
jgi:hypothetical protein